MSGQVLREPLGIVEAELFTEWTTILLLGHEWVNLVIWSD